LEEASLRLADLSEISTIQAGLQTAGWLRGGIDAESAAAVKRNGDAIRALATGGDLGLPDVAVMAEEPTYPRAIAADNIPATVIFALGQV
jgi:hypothetical protein